MARPGDVCAVIGSGDGMPWNVPEEYHEVGTAILMESDKGHTKTFLVTRVDRRTVTIDGNNPLCGREVIFRLEVLLVRDASEEEIEFGGKVEDVPEVAGTTGKTAVERINGRSGAAGTPVSRRSGCLGRLVGYFRLERFPLGFVANESLFIGLHLARNDVTGLAFRHFDR